MTDDERQTLNSWIRRRKVAQVRAVRLQIVQTCAQGGTIGAAAGQLGVSRDMARSGEHGSCGTIWRGLLAGRGGSGPARSPMSRWSR
jgi:hypothetical protein